MKKLYNTFHSIFNNLIFKYLLPAILMTAVVFILKIIISYFRQKDTNLRLKEYFKNEIKSYKNITFSATILYFLTIYQATIFNRIGKVEHEPLSNIFGGWAIINETYFYDLSLFWNIFMFLPMAFILHINYKQKGKNLEKSKLIILSTTYSFLASAVIEVSQIILCVGTFQISDLVYNTLGGVIGAGVMLLILKYSKSK